MEPDLVQACRAAGLCGYGLATTCVSSLKEILSQDPNDRYAWNQSHGKAALGLVLDSDCQIRVYSGLVLKALRGVFPRIEHGPEREDSRAGFII